MKEIYRSFDGQLSADTRDGYIINEGIEWLEYKPVSLYTETRTLRVRFRREDAPASFADAAAMGEVLDAVECGRIPGQVLYNGKWRTPQTLIQKHKDYNWWRHCT